MQIKQINPDRQITSVKSGNNKTNFKGSREILRAFAVDPVVSTLALEVPCDAGRSINAYKRGGLPEFRERITDDVVSAFFWIKGVDIFNALGDFIGRHFLKLPETDYSVSKDALRTPLDNLVDAQVKLNSLTQENAKKIEAEFSSFKFAKLLASSLLTVGFMGFLLPKINQFITKKMYYLGSKEKQKKEKKQPAYGRNIKSISFEDFDKKISNKPYASFKGNNLALYAHLLENNPICKMLVSDAGMTGGRYLTARNKDEGREYLFRDITSGFFYYASVPLIYKGFEKLAKSSKITSIDAVSAENIHKNVLNRLKDSGGKMTSDEFRKKTIGVLNEKSKEILDKIPFKNDVISLNELTGYMPRELIKKAGEMAKLQPEQASKGAVLTKQQVADVLKNGSINTPEFMQSIYTKRFGKNKLTNPYKFIPMKQITSFRDDIDSYVEKIIETAEKKNGGIVNEAVVNSVNKKSFALSFLFRAVAIGVSALALGVVIPKVQYAITAKRTGSNEAPGLRGYKNDAGKKSNL